jgi:hypothetical protein
LDTIAIRRLDILGVRRILAGDGHHARQTQPRDQRDVRSAADPQVQHLTQHHHADRQTHDHDHRQRNDHAQPRERHRVRARRRFDQTHAPDATLAPHLFDLLNITQRTLDAREFKVQIRAIRLEHLDLRTRQRRRVLAGPRRLEPRVQVRQRRLGAPDALTSSVQVRVVQLLQGRLALRVQFALRRREPLAKQRAITVILSLPHARQGRVLRTQTADPLAQARDDRVAVGEFNLFLAVSHHAVGRHLPLQRPHLRTQTLDLLRGVGDLRLENLDLVPTVRAGLQRAGELVLADELPRRRFVRVQAALDRRPLARQRILALRAGPACPLAKVIEVRRVNRIGDQRRVIAHVRRHRQFHELRARDHASARSLLEIPQRLGFIHEARRALETPHPNRVVAHRLTRADRISKDAFARDHACLGCRESLELLAVLPLAPLRRRPLDRQHLIHHVGPEHRRVLTQHEERAHAHNDARRARRDEQQQILPQQLDRVDRNEARCRPRRRCHRRAAGAGLREWAFCRNRGHGAVPARARCCCGRPWFVVWSRAPVRLPFVIPVSIGSSRPVVRRCAGVAPDPGSF